jgi:hypothetical protein
MGNDRAAMEFVEPHVGRTVDRGSTKTVVSRSGDGVAEASDRLRLVGERHVLPAIAVRMQAVLAARHR